MKFSKKLKVRIAIQGIYIIIGIAICIMYFYKKSDDAELLSFGAALAAASFVGAIKNISVLINPEKLKMRETYENDERNIDIMLRSKNLTLTAMTLILTVCTVLFMIFGMTFAATLTAMLVCVFLIIYIAAYAYYSRRG